MGTFRESSSAQDFAAMHNVNVDVDSRAMAGDDDNITVNRIGGVNELTDEATHVNRKRLVVVGLGMVALGEDIFSLFILDMS